MRPILTGLALILVAVPAWGQDLGTLNGTWEGSLTPVNAPAFYEWTEPYVFRIVISENNAQVFRSTKGAAFKEVKPGAFHIMQHRTNAVVVAIDSGNDNDGMWVQTYNFSVTLKDQNTLITNWYNVVNNTGIPLSSATSKFTGAAAGELTRVP